MKVMKEMKGKKRLVFSAIAIIAILALGGTIAFLSSNVTFQNLFHVADDVAEFSETFESPMNWTPCTETPKVATATNKNSTPRYVRMKINEYWRTKNTTISENDHETSDLSLTWTNDTGTHNYAVINTQNESKWELRSDGWYYYKTALGENQTTDSLLKSVTLNCDVNLVTGVTYSDSGSVGQSNPSDYAEAIYHIYVTFQMSDTNWQD